MLQKMRSSTGSWFAKGILGLLVLSFLGWGIADYTTGGGASNVVAEVGDREISYSEFANAYQRLLRDQGLNAVDPDVARQLQLGEAVVQSLAERALFEAEALSNGLTASDGMVRRAIEGAEEFTGITGEFSRQRFSDTLRQNGYTEEVYVEFLRMEIARNQLLDAMTAGVAAPEDLVQLMFNHFAERRNAEYMSLPVDSLSAPEAPDNAALQEFYEDWQEEFRRPELRTVTYSLITPEDVAASLEISEEDIAAAFDARRGEFSEPERRTILQALFANEDDAATAAEELSAVPLDEVEAKAEELGYTVIPLGSFAQGMVPNAALDEAAFGLPEPGVSSAFQGDFGWSIAIVTEISEASEPTLDDVRDQIRDDLALDRAYEEVFQRGNQLEDGFAQGMSLEEAASAAGHPAVTIDAVDAGGNGPNGSPLMDLPGGLLFLETVFDLQEGDVSFLETTESNAMFMARVDQIIPSAIPSLEEVRAEVEERWMEEARFERAETTAAYLVDRLNEGADLETLASFYPLAETGSIEGFARTGDGPAGANLPESLAQALFLLEVGGADYEPSGNAIIIARVTDTYMADSEDEETLRNALSGSLIDGMREDLRQQLGAALLSEHPVDMNPAAIEQIYQ